jgi:hypothetical protein
MTPTPMKSMTSASEPVEIGGFSVYCSVQGPSYEPLLRDSQEPEDEPSCSFIIREVVSGTVVGVFSLAERPDVGYFLSLLQTFGLSQDEAADLAAAFHLPKIGRIENRLYSP